jgi:hypothetical protein
VWVVVVPFAPVETSVVVLGITSSTVHDVTTPRSCITAA